MASVLRRLKKRRDFLRVAAKGRKWAAPGLVLQACPSPSSHAERANSDSRTNRKSGEARRMNRDIDSPKDIGVGFTASKKVGGAVERNRAKRRLRSLAREILPAEAEPGYDFVLIARRATLDRQFERLRADLRQALAKTGSARRGPEQRSKAS